MYGVSSESWSKRGGCLLKSVHSSGGSSWKSDASGEFGVHLGGGVTSALITEFSQGSDVRGGISTRVGEVSEVTQSFEPLRRPCRCSFTPTTSFQPKRKSLLLFDRLLGCLPSTKVSNRSIKSISYYRKSANLSQRQFTSQFNPFRIQNAQAGFASEHFFLAVLRQNQ